MPSGGLPSCLPLCCVPWPHPVLRALVAAGPPPPARSVWTICTRLDKVAGDSAMTTVRHRVVLASFGPRALSWALSQGVASLPFRDALLAVARVDAAAAELGPAADLENLRELKKQV